MLSAQASHPPCISCLILPALLRSALQLVLAFGVPTAVLWAAERQERRRFLEQRQQGERTVPGGGNSGTSAAAAAAEPSMSTRAADSSPLVCFPYVAALAWCLIRTACQLSMRE